MLSESLSVDAKKLIHVIGSLEGESKHYNNAKLQFKGSTYLDEKEEAP